MTDAKATPTSLDGVTSLYRRFRPGRFAELRGQDHIVRALQGAVKNDRVSHAYLFSGPRGTGKTTTARILAKALNCEHPVDGDACGVCESCVAISKGTSLDVIDPASSPTDEVEGTIYPSTCNGGANFGMILSDSSITTSGSPLASSGFGTGVCLTLSPSANFVVDSGILFGQPGFPTTNTGFSSTNDLLAGQTVRAKITGAASGTNGVNATATLMILRFSRLTGTIGTLSSPAFSINGLPTYITAFTVPPSVQTFTNATIFEGVANAGSLSPGATVSVAALFYNPVGGPQQPLQAAKVRQH